MLASLFYTVMNINIKGQHSTNRMSIITALFPSAAIKPSLFKQLQNSAPNPIPPNDLKCSQISMF